ncbi:hypothetical protein BGZ94_006773, partial [Podila epigama]
NLTTLSLRFLDSWDRDSEFELDREFDLILAHPPPNKNQIQTRKLYGDLVSYNIHMIKLIRHRGHLESVHLDTFSACHSPRFVESLARFCPRLVDLNALETPSRDFDVLPLLRAGFAGWKSSLAFHSCQNK